MIYNEFCGNNISRLGFGCMRFPKTFEETKECLHLAYNSGVNYFDTAYVYDNSEVTLGKIIKDFDRSKIFITSKMPIWDLKDEKDIDRIFNESLERLDVTYIDYYLVHSVTNSNFDNIKKFHVIDHLLKFKEEGKIKHLGFSMHAKSDIIEKMYQLYDFEFTQIQLNYLDVDGGPGLEGYYLLEKMNKPVIIMEPVKGGLLANLPSPLSDPFTEYNPELSIPSFCFNYLLGFKNVKVILSGMSNLEQTADNIKTFNNPIINDDKLLKAVDKVYHNILNVYKVGCTGCKYCMPCPKGVNIPVVFKVYNAITLRKFLGSNWISGLEYPSSAGPENCVGCGMCQKKCPQQLRIPDLMDEIKNSI